jgi:plastocyanin
MRRKWLIRTLAILTFAPALFLLRGSASGEESPASTGAQEEEVAIDNFSFTPTKLMVKPGTKVTWVNHDDVPHTVTSRARPRALDSGTLDTDGRYSHVFEKPGTYDYFCAVHPRMTGQIVVK